jgi:putative ABC transport system permease protein
MLAALSTSFAMLAAIGIYGVVSFSVRRRMREIGIRIAIGAAPARVFAGVLRGVTVYAGLGFALACPAIWYMTGLLADLLFRVSPLDAWSIGAACIAMAAALLAAAAMPAHSASRVDPTTKCCWSGQIRAE